MILNGFVKTVDYGLALLSAHSHNKISNNEAQNEYEEMATWCFIPWILRNRHWRDSLIPFIAF